MFLTSHLRGPVDLSANHAPNGIPIPCDNAKAVNMKPSSFGPAAAMWLRYINVSIIRKRNDKYEMNNLINQNVGE